MLRSERGHQLSVKILLHGSSRRDAIIGGNLPPIQAFLGSFRDAGKQYDQAMCTLKSEKEAFNSQPFADDFIPVVHTGPALFRLAFGLSLSLSVIVHRSVALEGRKPVQPQTGRRVPWRSHTLHNTDFLHN